MASRQKPPGGHEATAAIRFEATLGPASQARALAVSADLALDRLPDVKGKVRLLLSPDDARRLLEQGFEVHLLAAIPVAPIAEALVMSDRQSQDWLEARLKGIPREGRK